MTQILYKLVSDYWLENLQIAVIANGPHQEAFHKIVNTYGLHGRASVVDFDELLSRLGYAGSDFMFIPSLFDPCGLPIEEKEVYLRRIMRESQQRFNHEELAEQYIEIINKCTRVRWRRGMSAMRMRRDKKQPHFDAGVFFVCRTRIFSMKSRSACTSRSMATSTGF